MEPPKCPKCKSKKYWKFGFNGTGSYRKQRYKCLRCSYIYTVPELSTPGTKSWAYPVKERKRVIQLFDSPSKLSYQQIAKRVGGGISYGTVRNWITAHLLARQLLDDGLALEPTKKPTPPAAGDVGFLS